MSKRPATRENVAGIIGSIYDAALQPELWSAAVEQISDIFKGSTFVLHFGKLDSPEGFSATASADSQLYDLYRSEYLTPERNPGIMPLVAARPGTIIRREAILDDTSFRRTDFYNDIFRPHVLWHWMFGPVIKEPPHFGIFGICRRPAAGQFDRREFDLLRSLMPHLQRALQISVRLRALEVQKGGLEDVLCRLTIGVAILDATSRVILLNRAAEDIIAAADGLGMKNGRLVAATATETTTLSRLIADAASTGPRIGAGAGGATVLSRPSLKRPLTLLIGPLRCDSRRWALAPPAAVLFVSDPEHNIEPPTAILRRLYGFTQTEAAIAAMIVQGHDLKHTSDCLGMTFETARGYMKLILEKTGTHRQAEFVRLVLRGPASLRFD